MLSEPRGERADGRHPQGRRRHDPPGGAQRALAELPQLQPAGGARPVLLPEAPAAGDRRHEAERVLRRRQARRHARDGARATEERNDAGQDHHRAGRHREDEHHAGKPQVRLQGRQPREQVPDHGRRADAVQRAPAEVQRAADRHASPRGCATGWATPRRGRRRSSRSPPRKRSPSSRACKERAGSSRMAIKKYRPLTPGLRFKTSLTFEEITKKHSREGADQGKVEARGPRRGRQDQRPPQGRRPQARVPPDRFPPRQDRHPRQGQRHRVRSRTAAPSSP